MCPELVDYLNYIREYDETFAHPPGGSATIVATWRSVYQESTAKPPEVWRQGRFLPDGHTVSISDLYFVAHFARLLRSVIGEARECSANGVTLGSGVYIPADVLIKAVGFHVNERVERILGRSRLHGGTVLGGGLWCIFESHPDGNFSSGAFGSYLDAVPVKCRMLLRYWLHPELYREQLQRVFAAPSQRSSARINHVTGSEVLLSG